jgi:hypothetical protein
MSYPTSDLDSAKTFLSSLGSFWSLAFSENLESVMGGSLELNWQAYINYLEAITSVSRFTVPVYHTKLWDRLLIRKSEMNSALVSPTVYADSPHTYNDGMKYGDAAPTPNFRCPIGSSLAGAMQAVDIPIKPSTTLQAGVDYTIRAGSYIEFVADPFASGKFTARSIINTTTGLPDEEIELWLFKSSLDLNLIYEQFGYALGVYFSVSSENYKSLLNAIWDSMVLGPSAKSLRVAIGAISGAPVVRNSSETIEAIITTDSRYKQIITDKEVYTFSLTATPTVIVGQTVYAGDFLTDMVYLAESCDALTFFTNTGKGFYLDSSLVTTDLVTPLYVPGVATASNMTYTTDGDGFVTTVITSITGDAGDLTTFWANANAAGKATGKSLARALRPNPERTDQPGISELPTQINPALFFVQQIFGSNVVLLYIKSQQGLGASALTNLRKIVPAHVTVLQCA